MTLKYQRTHFCADTSWHTKLLPKYADAFQSKWTICKNDFSNLTQLIQIV